MGSKNGYRLNERLFFEARERANFEGKMEGGRPPEKNFFSGSKWAFFGAVFMQKISARVSNG